MDVIERPVLDGARKTGGAFDGYVRSGTTVELKAFTGTTGDSGGFAVPREIDAAIAGDGDPDKIANAELALDDGDALRAAALFKDAVAKYRDALATAEGA